MNRELARLQMINKGKSKVNVIDVSEEVDIFNKLRPDVKAYLIDNYLGIESSDFLGRARIKADRSDKWKLERIYQHLTFLEEICGRKSPRGRYDPKMYDLARDYVVNVMGRLLS